MEAPSSEWDIDTLSALTGIVVDHADITADIKSDDARASLIESFQRYSDRVARVGNARDALPQRERDIFVDIVWIISQLLLDEDAKGKAKWESLVKSAFNFILIDDLPPSMRRETLLCLKSITQGCVDTSTALKDILCPASSGKRNRRAEFENLTALSTVFLKCGDFDCQKHICELLFRLVKANLLDADVASTVFTHVSSQFKDLFKIKNNALMFKALKRLVRHFNAAQGSNATVSSFEATSLRFGALEMSDDWVNFGTDMLSAHAILDGSDGAEPVDILYSDIRTFSMPSSNVMHIGIRSKPIGLACDDPYDVRDDAWIQVEFQQHNMPAILEQVFRMSKHSTVIDLYITDSNLIPAKKVSTGILDLDIDLEAEDDDVDEETFEKALSEEKPKKAPVAAKKAAAKKTSAQAKPKAKAKAKPKSKSKAKPLVFDYSSSSSESESDEPKTGPVCVAVSMPSKPVKRLPSRKAKQVGMKKLNEQLDDTIEDFDLVEEEEELDTALPEKLPVKARRLDFSPSPLPPPTQVAPPRREESENDSESEDDAEWTFDDIPALLKMIKAKGTNKKQREEYLRVVADLQRSAPRRPPGKSVFKTPAASLKVPKTMNKAAQEGDDSIPTTTIGAKRPRSGLIDSVADWKTGGGILKKQSTAPPVTFEDINFDDDDDDDDDDERVNGEDDTWSPLSNFFSESNEISPILSSGKAQAKTKSRSGKPKSSKFSTIIPGDEMASLEQMMKSLAERNRRITRERINSLVNSFKIEAEAASRKLTGKIEQDFERVAAEASRAARDHQAAAKSIQDRVDTLTNEFKSQLRAAYEEFNAIKSAAAADDERFSRELANITRASESSAERFAQKIATKRTSVTRECDAARAGIQHNDGVKSMLLELARSM